MVLKLSITPLLPSYFTFAKPAAQQMMTGNVPEELTSGDLRVFVFDFCGRLYGINERTSGRNHNYGKSIWNGIKKVKMMSLRVLAIGYICKEGLIFVYMHAFVQKDAKLLPLFCIM